MNAKVQSLETRREAPREEAGDDNNEVCDFSAASAESDSECEEYERLVEELNHRDPSPEDFEALAHHERHCASGKHSEHGIEQSLDLPRGALRQGSSEHGLLHPRDVVDQLIKEHLTTSDSDD